MDNQMTKIVVKNDNRDKTLEEMNKLKVLALMACGEVAIGYAKGDCPVDTGRLRNSISYAVADKQEGANTSGGEHATEMEVKAHGKPKDGVCVIGTNVSYAEAQEVKHHYLRNAAGGHDSQYASLIKEILDK